MIIFENDGLIDKRSITTFGISSKETDSAIGYFGTGLKYAIAVLLRENISITICVGDERLCFTKEREAVRVDEFDFIYMNGERLAFTTELGKTWELWQAFREIYSNCLDESGTIYEARSFSAKEECTVISVEGSAFADIFYNKNDIFLESSPIYSKNGIEVHSGEGKYLFYKGVRVAELVTPTIYTYNIKTHITLTEDRTIKYIQTAFQKISELAITCGDESIIKSICTASKRFAEHDLDFDWSYEPSHEFLTVVGSLKNEFSSRLSASALKKYSQHVATVFHPDPTKLNDIQKMQLEKAINFNKLIGYQVDDYEIIVTDFMGEGVLGMAKDGRIFIATQVFMMGTKYLASTILEEFLHLRFKLVDETRNMQNFLFDAIMTVGEIHALKEPL